jgi:hypothetical protein
MERLDGLCEKIDIKWVCMQGGRGLGFVLHWNFLFPMEPWKACWCMLLHSHRFLKHTALTCIELKVCCKNRIPTPLNNYFLYPSRPMCPAMLGSLATKQQTFWPKQDHRKSDSYCTHTSMFAIPNWPHSRLTHHNHFHFHVDHSLQYPFCITLVKYKDASFLDCILWKCLRLTVQSSTRKNSSLCNQ